MIIAKVEGIAFTLSDAHLMPHYVQTKARKAKRDVRVEFPMTSRVIRTSDQVDIARYLEHALMLAASQSN